MFLPKHPRRYFLSVLIFLILTQTTQAQTENPQLIKLRQELATNYLEPAPHIALARYYWDRGDRLQAFYISEYARRARFPEPIFNQAFFSSFRGAVSQVAGTWLEDSKQSDASRLNESSEAAAIFDKAAELQKQGKLKQAEELFVKAASLAPDSVYIQSWTGRFFHKVKADNRRALEYYLNAYFLDPHAYETEFVESRISKINLETAAIKYGQMVRSGVLPTKILNDPNPIVVLLALEKMTAEWKTEYLPTVLDRMSHDDEAVRWQAAAAIMKNANRSFDKTLESLLRDDDQRKRGLAAYISAHLWKKDAFPFLQTMLREKSQLLRFDALSALILEGGSEGLQITLAHRQYETHPTLKKMIDKSLTQP